MYLLAIAAAIRALFDPDNVRGCVVIVGTAALLVIASIVATILWNAL